MHTCQTTDTCQPCAAEAGSRYRRFLRAGMRATIDGTDKLAQRAYQAARGYAHDALHYGDRGPLIDMLARSV